jgi:hypothetical protein
MVQASKLVFKICGLYCRFTCSGVMGLSSEFKIPGAKGSGAKGLGSREYSRWVRVKDSGCRVQG